MKRHLDRIAETLVLALLALASLAQYCWGAPPPPPTPSVPLGGPEVTIATTLVIAGYGVWKSRK